ncbi:MAG: hypothetical protein K6T83_15815 [Alicyclobacillus sp.]|nr:hypothetical protein [Alicyclobacillus sp.]
MRMSLRGMIPLAAVSATAVAMGLPANARAASIPTATVQVQQRTIDTLTSTPWGMNTAVWDSSLQDSVIPELLKGAGVTTLRFPGGSEADAYHWKTNSISLGGGNFGVDPSNTFDAFMAVAKKTGAQPIITVNYGSNAKGDGGGDPKEAAAWVKYANITKRYGVKYWEIGNENYGSWETNDWPVKTAAAYAKNSLTFIRDMKAVDPSIQVGVVLTCPGDGQDPTWNSTVLQTAGSKIDFDCALVRVPDAGIR